MLHALAHSGLYGHYIKTDLIVASLVSDADLERTGAVVYAGLDMGNVKVRIGGSYSDLKVDTRRTINFSGFSDSAKSRSNGETLQAFGEIGYRVGSDDNTFLEPFVGVSVEQIDLDEIVESGGLAALRVAKQDNSFATAVLGLRGETTVEVGKGNRLRISASTGAQHNFGDTRIVSTVALDAASRFGFPIAAAGVDSWAFVNSVRASLDIGESLTVGVDYSGLVAGSAQNHGVKATLGFRF